MSAGELVVAGQERLLAQCTTQASRVLENPAVKMAQAAAEGTEGLVVGDSAAATAVVDSALTVKRGLNAIDEWESRCLQLPRAMERVIRDVTRAARTPLSAAYKRLGDAHTAWVMAEKRRAEEERRKAAAEAAKVVQEARAEDESMPDMVIPRPEVPTITRGGPAATAYTSKRLEISVDDLAEAAKHYPTIFQLKTQTEAKTAFDRYLKANALKESDLRDRGDDFCFNGLRARWIVRSSFK